ncbi:hypothetical protein ABPG72_005748 [Tetrahymena utriculariae]
MSMEIEVDHSANIDVIDRYSPLGFRIPGFNDQSKIIEIIKQKFPENKGIEELRHPSNLTTDDLTRELKRENIILHNQNIVYRDSYFYIDAIDHRTLSETEQAFDNAYDPLNNVPGDNETQNWKNNQPSIKLIQSKEQKTINGTQVTGAQYVLDGKLVQSSSAAAAMVGAATNRNPNVIMQSHLTYQLTANPKSVIFDIKEPIILSANLVEKFCNCQKSYEGELMIKCSNDNCKITWFHPVCVGLGNINSKALEDLQFTCEDCKESERNTKKLSTNNGMDKTSRKKTTKN